MMRFAWLLLVLGGCGDDDGVVRFPPRDSGIADAGRDGGSRIDAGLDSGTDSGPLPTRDAGPAPACETAPSVAMLVPAFTGERDGDPDSFAMVSGGGPFAFGYRTQLGTGPTRTVRAMAVVAAGDGTVAGSPVAVDEVMGERVRLADVTVAADGAGGVYVAWAQEDTDDMGRIVAARVRHAGVAAGGALGRAGATLREMSTSPFVAPAPPEGPWLLRSDIVMLGEVTGVSPRLVHLDASGAPVGTERDLMAFLPPEALDVILQTATAGPFVAYRLGVSTAAVLPLDEGGSPRGTERRHEGVPQLDGAAGTDDALALVAVDVAGAMGRVEALVLDDLGNLRARHVVAADVPGGADVRAAVVAAWPGFVVLWRSGSGTEAQLRGAGLTTDGTLLIPAQDLVAIPGSTGALLADAGAGIIGAGARTPSVLGDQLQLAVTCGPRP